MKKRGSKYIYINNSKGTVEITTVIDEEGWFGKYNTPNSTQ